MQWHQEVNEQAEGLATDRKDFTDTEGVFGEVGRVYTIFFGQLIGKHADGNGEYSGRWYVWEKGCFGVQESTFSSNDESEARQMFDTWFDTETMGDKK